MKETYIKPESEINIVDIEVVLGVNVSGRVDDKPIGGGEGGETPPAEGDVNKSSLWDAEEDYI